jgi:threonine dehydratase
MAVLMSRYILPLFAYSRKWANTVTAGGRASAGMAPAYTPVMAQPAMPLRDIPLEDIGAARVRIAGRIARTPLLHSRTAAREIARVTGIRIGGGGVPDRPGGDASPAADEPRVFLKAEHLQVTGSFKARGALNRILTLTPEERARGIVTMSAGNHAAAVAYASAAIGIPVTVVMPVAAPRAKVEATTAYGARIELYGAHTGETHERMEQLRQERGAVYVSPFDDPRVIEGQGTVGLEILEDLPDVDLVVLGVGGGGLLAGVAAAVRQLRPSARVVGVEPARSDALSQALAAGRPVDIRPDSIADGLGAPFAGPWNIDLARRYAEPIVRVADAVIARGMRFALERMKQVLEPAGAAALGALLSGAVSLRQGELVCVIASGGNVDMTRVPMLLAVGDAQVGPDPAGS